jgi:hypothetical protein
MAKESVSDLYQKYCYRCANEETTFCDGCPAKEIILKAEQLEKEETLNR